MKSWLIPSLWTLFVMGLIFLLANIKSTLQNQFLGVPKIHIKVEGENAFLTENELLTRLKQENFLFVDQKVKELETERIERFILKMNEVKSVDVFTHFGGDWSINLELRKPIARVFNNTGQSFYLDSDGFVMKTSLGHTARVVVVTGNVPDLETSESVKDIINNDSLKTIRKLDDVYRISNYVCNDLLMQSLIGQIHREMNGDFVLIPIAGGQKIIFGSANSDQDVNEKFKKLKIFYKEAIPFEGWNKYSMINLKYDKQIVCKKIE